MTDRSLPQAAPEASTPVDQEVRGVHANDGKVPSRSAQIKRRVAIAISSRPKWLVIAWVVVVLAFVAIVPIAYVSWWIGMPRLVAWPGEQWWLWIPAAFGMLMLAIAPIWAVMIAAGVFEYVTDLSLEVNEESLRKVQSRVEETELEAIRRFENSDDAGLLPLLTYSRAQLDAYYHLGLSQTRRSFFHGIIAMWLGFALLLVGLALHIVPLGNLGLIAPTQEFKILLLGGAAIIEFISALFLWMYKSTTAQLIYLYDRQMFSHTAILSFRMASAIKDQKGDETRANIVKKLLDWKPGIEHAQLPRGTGLSSLAQKPAPKPTE